MEKDPALFKPWFNQGGAWYEADSLDKAMEAFEMALSRINDPKEKAAVFHNIGNSLMKQEDYAKSIEAFRQALLNNPYDEDTRYNLAYAMTKLQQQQDGEGDNQQQNEDQEQDKEDEQQQQDQGEQEQQENEQQQQSQQQKMDPQQAEQMLKALENEDKNTQEKVTREMMKVEPKKREKDW
jgi:Ca-activated chloride channel homolog